MGTLIDAEKVIHPNVKSIVEGLGLHFTLQVLVFDSSPLIYLDCMYVGHMCPK